VHEPLVAGHIDEANAFDPPRAGDAHFIRHIEEGITQLDASPWGPGHDG
jgi:hypothetical protein